MKAVISSSYNLEDLYRTSLNYMFYLRCFAILRSAEW